MGSSGLQNDSKVRQNRQPEPEKKAPPTGADKFFELFVKAAKKNQVNSVEIHESAKKLSAGNVKFLMSLQVIL